jgi:hypothetical protein
MKTLADFREAVKILANWCAEQPGLMRFDINIRPGDYTSPRGVGCSIIAVYIYTGGWPDYDWHACQHVPVFNDKPPEHIRWAALKGIEGLKALLAERPLAPPLTSPEGATP